MFHIIFDSNSTREVQKQSCDQCFARKLKVLYEPTMLGMFDREHELTGS